jgi:hypothetical protein
MFEYENEASGFEKTLAKRKKPDEHSRTSKTLGAQKLSKPVL